VLFPATEGMEENTTCAPDPSTSRPSALKSLLVALGLLSAISSPMQMIKYNKEPETGGTLRMYRLFKEVSCSSLQLCDSLFVHRVCMFGKL